jgi:protoheme IX farnesyltransferase
MTASRYGFTAVKESPVNALPVAVDGSRPQRFDALGRSHDRRWTTRMADYIALAKPRLNLLVVASSAAGYYLGSTGTPSIGKMAVASVGTALVAGGAAALNQAYERNTDAMMRRTRLRPLPDGRVAVHDAITFGLALAVSGLALLALQTNALAAALAVATLALYLAVYTPLKRRSPISTLVGAVPGALPPVIGWTASHGSVSSGGTVLFALLFLWQIPHFMAIAWLCRDDYRTAGFPMLPVIEPDGRRTGRQAAVYATLLLPVSLCPFWIGLTGVAYLATAATLGVVLLGLAIRFAESRTDRRARTLFLATIAYLPLIWLAMIVDRQ